MKSEGYGPRFFNSLLKAVNGFRRSTPFIDRDAYRTILLDLCLV